MLQRYLPVQHPAGRQPYHRDLGKALHFLTQTEMGGIDFLPKYLLLGAGEAAAGTAGTPGAQLFTTAPHGRWER